MKKCYRFFFSRGEFSLWGGQGHLRVLWLSQNWEICSARLWAPPQLLHSYCAINLFAQLLSKRLWKMSLEMIHATFSHLQWLGNSSKLFLWRRNMPGKYHFNRELMWILQSLFFPLHFTVERTLKMSYKGTIWFHTQTHIIFL